MNQFNKYKELQTKAKQFAKLKLEHFYMLEEYDHNPDFRNLVAKVNQRLVQIEYKNLEHKELREFNFSYEWDLKMGLINDHSDYEKEIESIENDIEELTHYTDPQPYRGPLGMRERLRYKPNFDDLRVFNKATTAVGFAFAHFSETEPRQWSSRDLQEYLGRTNKALGKYLHYMTIKCTKEHYDSNRGICKEYILNKEGIESLCNSIANSVHSRVLRLSFDNQTHTNETHYLHSVHLLEHLGLKYTERYQDELSSKQFNYNFVKTNNRWYHGLQNVKKRFRNQALAQNNFNYNYDIDCAMPSIVLSMANLFGNNQPTPMINELITNKLEFRQYFSNLLDIDVNKVKVMITATFNGAKMSKNHTMGKIAGDLDKLKQDHKFNMLQKEIKHLWSVIKTYYEREFTKEWNEIVKTSFSSRNKSYLYSVYEHKVAQVVQLYLKKHNINYFWIHDGWYTDKQLDTEHLQKLIKKTTKMNIKLTEEINK